jgi:hypothetical protein
LRRRVLCSPGAPAAMDEETMQAVRDDALALVRRDADIAG